MFFCGMTCKTQHNVLTSRIIDSISYFRRSEVVLIFFLAPRSIPLCGTGILPVHRKNQFLHFQRPTSTRPAQRPLSSSSVAPKRAGPTSSSLEAVRHRFPPTLASQQRGSGVSPLQKKSDPSTSNVDAARSTAPQSLFSCTQASGPDFFLSEFGGARESRGRRSVPDRPDSSGNVARIQSSSWPMPR